MTKKILLIEDNPIIAAATEGILQQSGRWEVITYSDGAEAMIHAFANPPDLVFINVQCAGEMDGLEIVQLLRRYFRYPIVFLTGMQQQHIATYPSHFHPCIILFKPFDAFQLIEIADLILND